MADLHALITELANELDHNRQCLLDDRRVTHPLADKARAAIRADKARAAIREVAAWMREQQDGDLIAATMLEQEAGR
jgi:transposase